jgi:sensor c-di-GMP phosphodiesterase-like protein
MKNRIAVALVISLSASLLGLTGGYFLGRSTILHNEARHLQHGAETGISDVVANTREYHTFLNTIAISPYPFCSEQDLRMIRTRIFQSRTLKEAGRIADGKFACSAMYGSQNLPSLQQKPDFVQLDGTEVYYSSQGFRLASDSAGFIRIGDAYIVQNPYEYIRFGLLAPHFSFTVYDASTGHAKSVYRDSDGDADIPEFTSNGTVFSHGWIYVAACSSTNRSCLIAFESNREALHLESSQFMAFLLAGGASGSLLGLCGAFFYSRRRSIEQQLLRALKHDRLRVVYQPVVNILDGSVVGAEALVRWTNEEGGELSPLTFIPVAEKNGFAGQVTSLVLRHALRDFQQFLQSRPDFQLNINIAPADLLDPDFLPMLDASLNQARVAATSIGIEITESCIVEAELAVKCIQRLRQRGHTVYIDDFGTGYSSLSYLHSLDIDALKIDRAFTRAIGTEAVTLSIVPHILALAEDLHLQIVVEGVETKEQAEYFSSSGKPMKGQGWLYGYPVDAKVFQQQATKAESSPQAA